MFYTFLYPLSEHWPILHLFKYITFRTIGAVLTALVISFLLGPWLIRTLKSVQKHGQPIRDDGPERHLLQKSGTPTMGGLLILIAIVAPTLLWADLSNGLIAIVLLTTSGFGVVGGWDDYKKLVHDNSRGVPGWIRFSLQILIALTAVSLLKILVDDDGRFGALAMPFFKSISLDLGWFFIPFSILVVVGSSNAVNLTDGLDGLAIGPAMMAAASFSVIAYLTGHLHFADYLGIPYVAGAGELAVFCGAMVGAALGFLWFNTYPAQVFMGDIGSLSLGAALGCVAVMTRHEIVLAIIGGIFVIETVSVMVQVLSFKWTGKRVFRMAPIHHHFELKGWAEPKIIVRFWIVSIILALIGLATLKVR